MRIALAQINPTVGDLAGNCRKAIDFIGRAKAAGARLVVFPELSVTGAERQAMLRDWGSWDAAFDDALHTYAHLRSKVG